ncbi:Mitotic checkpoint protein BUB3.2 [Linum perenne]
MTAAVPPPGSGRELSNPPTDGISNLRFSNLSDHLLVSSWDKTVRLYDASANLLLGEFLHGGAVLDCCFHDESSGFSASADNLVRRLVFNHGKEDILGKHDAPVRCIEYSYAAGQVITGSWDRTVKCWDPRGASGQDRTLVGTYPQPERVYSLSLVGNRVVVATAGRHVNVYDLRNMSQPEQQRESSLKYQTRCVRCYPNGTGYALSSVEGRVAMEFFDLSEAAQAKKWVVISSAIIFNSRYAFKCHRKSEAGRDIVYPVNAIAFHPVYGTFATGGCDGFVNVWDGNNKKRLYQYSKYPSSIAALSFSKDGRLLAVASSYTYEEGDKPHEPDSIFVRSVNEVEVKPKPKVYPNPHA